MYIGGALSIALGYRRRPHDLPCLSRRRGVSDGFLVLAKADSSVPSSGHQLRFASMGLCPYLVTKQWQLTYD